MGTAPFSFSILDFYCISLQQGANLIKKIYLIYMDEARHVHWHLMPRYNEKGHDIFLHKTKKIVDFFLVSKIKARLKF